MQELVQALETRQDVEARDELLGALQSTPNDFATFSTLLVTMTLAVSLAVTLTLTLALTVLNSHADFPDLHGASEFVTTSHHKFWKSVRTYNK